VPRCRCGEILAHVPRLCTISVRQCPLDPRDAALNSLQRWLSGDTGSKGRVQEQGHGRVWVAHRFSPSTHPHSPSTCIRTYCALTGLYCLRHTFLHQNAPSKTTLYGRMQVRGVLTPPVLCAPPCSASCPLSPSTHVSPDSPFLRLSNAASCVSSGHRLAKIVHRLGTCADISAHPHPRHPWHTAHATRHRNLYPKVFC